MGIRHLYSHLSPYARPETFDPASSRAILYIDGPALCHHIYHLLFCAGSPAGGNAFETTLNYRTLALAFGSYLSRLSTSGFEIKKILFDSALPASKTATRLSRLSDYLTKLSRYRSANPTLRHGTPSSISTPEHFFSPTSTTVFTPRTQHLSAPPFIVAAILSWLSSHPVYSGITETVPGEADSFLAAAAIKDGGMVLTSDSDLLVFSGETNWGVVMLQDLTFTPTGATTRVFRPSAIAASLKFPLIEVAYQTSLDPYASLSQILERLQRVEERRRLGVGVQAIPDAFVGEYMLPVAGERRMVEEPRIGELLFLASSGAGSGARKMYFPFLNEDPQRAAAWEVGVEVRALAYTLLFTTGEVKEIFRRGTRITDSSVPCVADSQTQLDALAAQIAEHPETWWASVILNSICVTSRTPPSCAELTAAASALLPHPTVSKGVKQKWTWALVHLFAMVQAGWYSSSFYGRYWRL
ncbi:XPG domain containing-domain-containing protein [Trichophaea hybrida]|nr:XPG domain containing-domain-containing protein [Trichophaea hybrida]